jgi:hypothetical protein
VAKKSKKRKIEDHLGTKLRQVFPELSYCDPRLFEHVKRAFAQGNEQQAIDDLDTLIGVTFAGAASTLRAEAWKKAAEHAKSASTINSKRADILLCLDAAWPVTLKQDDVFKKLGDDKSQSEKTIGQNMAWLRHQGLTWRPHGERGGDTVTDRGRQTAKTIRQTTD